MTAASAVGRPDAHAGEVPVAYVTLAPAATVTEDDLRDWASQRVPDRTAAPKTVTVLHALPVTAVGKPYKVALRADATRAELRAALGTIAGVHDVDVTVEGSAIVAVCHRLPVRRTGRHQGDRRPLRHRILNRPGSDGGSTLEWRI